MIAVGKTSILGFIRPKDNFRVVRDGKVYRSKQLSPSEFSQYVERHGIQTILNLRHGQVQKASWQQKKQQIERAGCAVVSIPLRGFRYPTSAQVKQLLDFFHATQGPVLIHCKRGRDRTGMVAGLWRIEREQANYRQAKKEITFWRHGHIGLPMKRFLQLWEKLRHETDSIEQALERYTQLYEGGLHKKWLWRA